MAQQGGAAEAGPAVDLRDDDVVRSSLFFMLVDWDGSDLKNVYEPVSDQIGYIFSAGLLILVIGIVIGVYKKWYRIIKETPFPYKVIKPPAHVVENKTSGKRVVAVLGSTGFIGSHLVDCLIESGQYHVYMLGRRFSEEKIHPKADAVFQVDMTNYASLVNAFSGVDSVIHSAAAFPTVYTSSDDFWRINTVGTENIIAAAKECGVKNLVFVSGLKFVENQSNTGVKLFSNCFERNEQAIIKANGDGLSTCVIALSQIYGLRNPLFEMVLKGQMTRIPLLERQASFTPVEFAANAIKNAEQKLSEKSTLVVGKILTIMGQQSTFKEIFSLPQWGIRMQNLPLWMMIILAKTNQFVATITGLAPMGAEFSPVICYLIDNDEEEYDNTIVQEALGIDEVPLIEEGISKMVAEFKQREEAKKNK